MSLRWIAGDAVVDESTFLPGKELLLEAYASPAAPTVLQVFQTYSSALRQVLAHIGVPERRSGPEFGTVGVPPDRHRSDRVWRLPTPRGLRKSASFVFVDDVSEQISGPVYSSRVGKAQWTVQGAAKAADPAGLIPIGVEGNARVSGDFVFATDPELSLQLLTGDDLRNHMVSLLLEEFGHAEEGENADVAARVELAVRDLAESLDHAYTPPDAWSARLTPEVIRGSEGDVAEFGLELSTPVQGSGYFAIGCSDPENPELAETTDAWLVNVDAELTVSVMRDPSAIALPQVAVA